QRDAEVAAELQAICAVERRLAAVGSPARRIVDRAPGERSGLAVLGQSAQDLEADDRPRPQRGVGIALVAELAALVVDRRAEPRDAAAETRVAREDLDGRGAALGEPDADRAPRVRRARAGTSRDDRDRDGSRCARRGAPG